MEFNVFGGHLGRHFENGDFPNTGDVNLLHIMALIMWKRACFYPAVNDSELLVRLAAALYCLVWKLVQLVLLSSN